MAPSSEKRSFLSRDFTISSSDMSNASWGMENDIQRSVMLNIRYRYLALVTIVCAGASFIFCIVYSFIFHFDEVTSTHCNAWNVAPSVSGIIQQFSFLLHNVLCNFLQRLNFNSQRAHKFNFQNWKLKSLQLNSIIINCWWHDIDDKIR